MNRPAPNLARLLPAALLAAAGAGCASTPAPEAQTRPLVQVAGGTDLSGDDARAALERARTLHAEGRDEGALSLLGALGRAPDPVRRQALALAGVIHARRGDLVAAEARLRAALAGDDSWSGAAAALHDLAVVRLRVGDEDEGLRLLERAAAAHRAAGHEDLARESEQARLRYLELKRRGTTSP